MKTAVSIAIIGSLLADPSWAGRPPRPSPCVAAGQVQACFRQAAVVTELGSFLQTLLRRRIGKTRLVETVRDPALAELRGSGRPEAREESSGLRDLMISNAFSKLGLSMNVWGQQIYMYWLTRSAQAVGIGLAAGSISSLLSIWTGRFSERLSPSQRRRALLIVQVIPFLTSIALTAAALTRTLRPVHIVTASLAQGTAISLMNPLYQSVLGDLAPAHAKGKAISDSTTLSMAAFLLGTLVLWRGLAVGGPIGWSFMANALGAVLLGATIHRIDGTGAAAPAAVLERRAPAATGTIPVSWALLWIPTVLANFLGNGLRTIFPVVAHVASTAEGPFRFGAYAAFWTAGSIVGAWALRHNRESTGRLHRSLLWNTLALAVGTLGLYFLQNTVSVMLCLILANFAITWINWACITLYASRRHAASSYGRFFGVSGLSTALGQLAIGWVFKRWAGHEQTVLLVEGLIWGIVFLALWALHRPAEPTSTEGPSGSPTPSAGYRRGASAGAFLRFSVLKSA